MKQTTSGFLLGVLPTISLPVLAGNRDGFGDGHWEGGEIHRFNEQDLGIWRGGHWRRGLHGGRMGWCRTAAGIWYFYPGQVYPYPDPYTPAAAIINQQPQVVVRQSNTPILPQQTAQTWHYCDSAKKLLPICAKLS